jgi:hypothetical protein
MPGIDPILTAITSHALAYAALLCTIGTRLAIYISELLMGIGEKA